MQDVDKLLCQLDIDCIRYGTGKQSGATGDPDMDRLECSVVYVMRLRTETNTSSSLPVSGLSNATCRRQLRGGSGRSCDMGWLVVRRMKRDF